jgi:hypothetical protein
MKDDIRISEYKVRENNLLEKLLNYVFRLKVDK